MDVLTDVCANLRLRAGMLFSAELAAPFSVGLPQEARQIRFHLLLEGELHLSLSGHWTRVIAPGDMVLVTEGAAHGLMSGPGAGTPLPVSALMTANSAAEGVIRLGAPAAACILSGYFGFDPAVRHPLLSDLPAMLTLRQDDAAFVAGLRLMREEAQGGAGAEFVLHRTAEVLLIRCLRQLARAEGAGFLAALGDPALARCLTAIHRAPGQDWTVAALAREAKLSRSILSERFTAKVGMPPVAYLTHWRMILARRMLSDTALTVEEVAARSGYASLPAFSRRFSQMFGKGPGPWRRDRGA